MMDLEGFQQDIFATGVPDGVDVAAVEELYDWQAAQREGTLFSLDETPRQASWGTSIESLALRLLDHPVCRTLAQLDLQSAPPHPGNSPAQLKVRTSLDAAGHALLVASSIEREIRRCERAAKRVERRGRAGNPTEEFLHVLGKVPHPWGIKDDGLRLTNAELGADGRLRLLMSEPATPYACLAYWPRLTVAFAASAIADLELHLDDTPDRKIDVRLPPARLKAIAGGVPRGSVEIHLRSSIADVCARV